jgi:hypothetical protein
MVLPEIIGFMLLFLIKAPSSGLELQYSFDRRLDGLQGRSERVGDKERIPSLSTPGIEPRLSSL